LIEPVQAVRNTILAALTWKKPMLIVIDALDECDDKDAMAEFIQSLMDVCQENRRLLFRVFCASRIEEHL
jgi:hypothetical protein